MEASLINGFCLVDNDRLFKGLTSRSSSVVIENCQIGLKQLTIPSNLASFNSLISSNLEGQLIESQAINLRETFRGQVKGKSKKLLSVVRCDCEAEGSDSAIRTVTFCDLPPLNSIVLGPTVHSSIDQLKSTKEIKFGVNSGVTRLFTASCSSVEPPIVFQTDFMQSSLKVYISVRGTIRRLKAVLSVQSVQFEKVGRFSDGLMVSLLNSKEAIVEAETLSEVTRIDFVCQGGSRSSVRVVCSFESDELVVGAVNVLGRQCSVKKSSVCESFETILID